MLYHYDQNHSQSVACGRPVISLTSAARHVAMVTAYMATERGPVSGMLHYLLIYQDPADNLFQPSVDCFPGDEVTCKMRQLA